MKLKMKELTSAALALALAAAWGTTAHAQNIDDAATGDLILGFNQSGASNEYVVDLGPVSNFIGISTPQTFNLSTTDLSADFTNWTSNAVSTTTLQWGVVGASASSGSTVDGVADKTLFYTQGELVAGTQSTPPAELSSSTQGSIAHTINATFIGNVLGVSTPSANDSEATSEPSTTTDGWVSELGNNEFGIGTDIEQPGSGSYTGPTDSVLDLYESSPSLTSAPASLLGSFSLSTNAVLTFDPEAVPEPSSLPLAAIAMTLVTVLVLRRRKAISN